MSSCGCVGRGWGLCIYRGSPYRVFILWLEWGVVGGVLSPFPSLAFPVLSSPYRFGCSVVFPSIASTASIPCIPSTGSVPTTITICYVREWLV